MTTPASPTDFDDFPDVDFPDVDFPDVDFPDVDFPDVDFPDMEFPDLSDDYLLLDSSDWEDLGLGPPSQQFPTGSEWDSSWLGSNNSEKSYYNERGIDILPVVLIVAGVAFVLVWICCATVGNKKYGDKYGRNNGYNNRHNTNLCVDPGTNDLVTDGDEDVIELKEVVEEPQQVVIAQAVAVETTEVVQIPTTAGVVSTAPVADTTTRDCETGEF